MNKQIKNFFSKNNEFKEIKYTSKNENSTITFADEFASYLDTGDIVVLTGELGAGKTVFMYGIAKYFNIQNQVSSPTFTIVNEYMAKKNGSTINIYHFDVYRLKDEDDFLDSIGTDYFSNGICIIEWGKNIQNILPKNTIYIDISKDIIDTNSRHFIITRGIK